MARYDDSTSTVRHHEVDRNDGTRARRIATRSPVRRRGLSLVEVLMSIFVIAIGLLGVAALLPLAHYEASQGTIEDRIGFVGRRFWRDFLVRGWDRPDNWLSSNGAAMTVVPGQAYCIDPRFVARNSATGSLFPSTGTAIAMPRISLRSAPDGPLMGMFQADELFTSRDDLFFIQSEDKDLRPIQKFTTGNAKRESDGHFSWMATVVPAIDIEPDATDSFFPALTDQYVFSLVLFHQRDSTMTPGNLLNERDVVITFHGGWGGGDATLTSSSPIDVRSGNWLLAAQTVPGAVPIYVFKWYRVIRADDANDGDATTRDVTLAGPDWEFPGSTQATIVDGVVAIFEKTIQLENFSLW